MDMCGIGSHVHSQQVTDSPLQGVVMVNLVYENDKIRNHPEDSPLGMPMGAILIRLIKVRRLVHSGWHYSLD